MAKENQSKLSLGLDRRQLLTTAAAVTVAGIVPTRPTEAASLAVAALNQTSLPVSLPPALNVCASTARRIEEIAARNRIRQEAGLPLLSIPKELRRMKAVADAAEFNEFCALHWEAVWQEVLAPVREARGEPNWRPTRFREGVGYQAQVGRILRKRFVAKQHF